MDYTCNNYQFFSSINIYSRVHVCHTVCAYSIVCTSDVPIIGSVIGIGHFQPLFLVSVSVFLSDVTNIGKNVPTMSFLVIIVSSITHN